MRLHCHKHKTNHQDGELCGDLLRTEGSSSLKSVRAGSTGETREKTHKKKGQQSFKTPCMHIYILKSPHHYLNQPESKEKKKKQIDLLSFSLSLSFLRPFEKDTYSTTPSSPFLPEMGRSFMAVVQQRQRSSRRKK